MDTKRKPIALLLLLFGALGCGRVDFQGQDIRMRHDLEGDGIDIELTYHGVMAPEAKEGELGRGTTKDMERAVEAIERMARGERYLMLLSPIFEIDLDKYEVMHRSALESPEPGESARFLQIIDRFSVQRSEVDLDEKGRLVVRQWIHIRGAQEATRELNRSIREAFLLWEADFNSFDDQPATLIDASTLASWVEEARLGKDWVTWDGQTLVLSVPMNAASAARLLRAQVRAVAEEPNPTFQKNMGNLVDMIHEIQLEDGHLTLRIAPNEKGYLSLNFVEDDRPYRPSLLETLRTQGFPLPKLPPPAK
jgi:hypothetical protein